MKYLNPTFTDLAFPPLLSPLSQSLLPSLFPLSFTLFTCFLPPLSFFFLFLTPSPLPFPCCYFFLFPFTFPSPVSPLFPPSSPSSSCLFFSQLSDDRSFQVRCRFDTDVELAYFKHGGILNYMIRKMSADTEPSKKAAYLLMF